MAPGSSVPFDLEATVRELAARRDIADAVQRYMRGLDRLDPVLQRSAFHDDAQVDCGLMAGSVDAFVAFSQDMLAGFDATHHLLGQVSITVEGDVASGECYFQAWHGARDAQGNPRDLFIAGRYIDAYACLNGEWRITRRTLITDWIKDDPADHGFFAANPGIIRSGRRGADYSQRMPQ